MNKAIVNQELIDVIFRLGRLIRQQTAHEVKPETINLTVLQLEILIFLKKHDTIKMSDIADHFHITMPTATVMVNKLVDTGLVGRSSDENDRRIVKIGLTDHGNDLLTEGLKQKNEKMNKILGLLSDTDKQVLHRILKNLVEKAETSYEK